MALYWMHPCTISLLNCTVFVTEKPLNDAIQLDDTLLDRTIVLDGDDSEGKHILVHVVLSTKEPYTIMLCPPLASSVLASASLVSVYTSPCHRFTHKSIIFGRHMHLCPSYMHIKYLVILTCSS